MYCSACTTYSFNIKATNQSAATPSVHWHDVGQVNDIPNFPPLHCTVYELLSSQAVALWLMNHRSLLSAALPVSRSSPWRCQSLLYFYFDPIGLTTSSGAEKGDKSIPSKARNDPTLQKMNRATWHDIHHYIVIAAKWQRLWLRLCTRASSTDAVSHSAEGRPDSTRLRTTVADVASCLIDSVKGL